MEQTGNARFELMTLNCDLDLGSERPSYEFCKPSHGGELFTKFHENLS